MSFIMKGTYDRLQLHSELAQNFSFMSTKLKTLEVVRTGIYELDKEINNSK